MVPADRSTEVAALEEEPVMVVLSNVTAPELVRSTTGAAIVEPEAVLRSALVASTDSDVPAVELFKVTALVDWSVTEAVVPADRVKEVALVLVMSTEPEVADAVKLAVLMLPLV